MTGVLGCALGPPRTAGVHGSGDPPFVPAAVAGEIGAARLQTWEELRVTMGL